MYLCKEINQKEGKNNAVQGQLVQDTYLVESLLKLEAGHGPWHSRINQKIVSSVQAA